MNQRLNQYLNQYIHAAGLVSVLLLASCGGGDSGPVAGSPGPAPAPSPPPVAVACTISYTVTNNPILNGPDPLIAQQWHLNNTGQSGGLAGEDVRAFSAWSITKGAGIRVAVIDDAVETIHPDLSPNIVPGASYNYLTQSNLPLPCVAKDDHGTQVAGLILARDGNGIGVAGVAPRASLVGFNALSSSFDSDVANAMTRDGQINQIMHNSWGSPDNGFLNPAESLWGQAVDNGIASGRGGKGLIYVFPSGNGGVVTLPMNKATTENSNFDGYVNRRGVITVCATNDRGERPSFGENGANILICAPTETASSGATTTTLQSGYTSQFDGTSSSSPMVSGVVALMLSVNPNLSARDIPLILAETARKNNPSDSAWAGTGSARFNHKFGYGTVDALLAVSRAQTWTSVGTAADLKSCGLFTSTPNRAIPDAAVNGSVSPISDAIAVNNCPITKIEYVDVFFTSSHAYPADLRLRLISPSGTVSELADNRTCGQGLSPAENPCLQNYNNWRFGSVRHLNEGATGNWRFEITDMNTADVGTFQSWGIRIWGR